MKGLASNRRNALNEYKSTINIKKRDVLAASKAAADIRSTDNVTVKPEIITNRNAQDEADRKNVFRLSAIGVKERISEGITNIVGKDITNPILQTTNDSDFKYVDKYQIINFSPPPHKGRRGRRPQTPYGSLSTPQEQFSTGGRRPSPTYYMPGYHPR